MISKAHIERKKSEVSNHVWLNSERNIYLYTKLSKPCKFQLVIPMNILELIANRRIQLKMFHFYM